MIPVTGFQDQNVIVLGIGRSGLSAAVSLANGGANVTCWDDGEAGRARANAQGFRVEDPLKGGLHEADCLITSPGIPHLYPSPHPILAEAMRIGVPIDNDIGLFFRSLSSGAWDAFETPPRVITVTGSNGKSTTSALIHHMLEVADVPTQLAGNIGLGVLDIEPLVNGEVVVLELSSYQTELARSLTPDIAVFTNLSPDHLDRHAGLGGYFAAKQRLFTQGGPDRAIIGVDEIEGHFLANQMAMAIHDDRVIRVSSGQKLAGPGWSVSARKGFLSEVRKNRQTSSVDLRDMTGLPGAHNHQNGACAYAALRALNIAPKVLEKGMASFAGLPHRSQTIGTKNGVIFVNDSKATNVDSAVQALGAFKNIRWICGGEQKAGSLDALWEASQNVIKAYVIGEKATEFAGQLGISSEVCTTMDVAVQTAFADAKEGDVILLAPAAASFDQYSSFETRGDHFVGLYNDL